MATSSTAPILRGNAWFPSTLTSTGRPAGKTAAIIEAPRSERKRARTCLAFPSSLVETTTDDGGFASIVGTSANVAGRPHGSADSEPDAPPSGGLDVLGRPSA